MNQPVAADPALDSSVRQRLLQAAIDLFAEKGFAATSVREIVAAAGVTKPVLYYYFQSKEGIYLEIMRGMVEQFLAPLEQAPAPGGAVWDRLLAVAALAFDAFMANLKVMKIIFAMYYGPPQGAPFVDTIEVFWRFQEVVVGLVKEGLASGEFRPGDPQAITWMLMGVVHLAMELEMCQPERGMGREGLLRVLGLVRQSLAAEGTL